MAQSRQSAKLFSPVVGIGSPPTPYPHASVPPPLWYREEGHTRWREGGGVGGGRVPNPTRRHTLLYSVYCIFTLWHLESTRHKRYLQHRMNIRQNSAISWFTWVTSSLDAWVCHWAESGSPERLWTAPPASRRDKFKGTVSWECSDIGQGFAPIGLHKTDSASDWLLIKRHYLGKKDLPGVQVQK